MGVENSLSYLWKKTFLLRYQKIAIGNNFCVKPRAYAALIASKSKTFEALCFYGFHHVAVFDSNPLTKQFSILASFLTQSVIWVTPLGEPF